MNRKGFWFICLAVLAVGLLIYWRNSRDGRQKEINDASRLYTKYISTRTILDGRCVWGSPGSDHAIYVQRWLDAKNNFIYEYEVISRDAVNEIELRRFKISDKLSEIEKVIVYGLLNEVYDQKPVIEYEERFVLSDSSVVCSEYQKFCRKDGRPFTSRERDAGESVGVMLYNWDSDSLYWDENDWSVMEHCRNVLKDLHDLAYPAKDKK